MAERSAVGRPRDVVIAELAERQFGVVARVQLLAAGISANAIVHRLKTGRLHPLHRGVYAVGHRAVPPSGHELAAALACGEAAVVSHHAAAARWGIRPPHEGPLDITIVAGGSRHRRGVRIHRVLRLDARDIRSRGALRITAPARTVLDVACELSSRELERAVAEGQARRLITDVDLAGALGRAPNRPGARALRALIRAELEPALTRSEAEERLLALVQAGGLPRPQLNVRVRGCEVDMLWREAGLVVEVDGYAFHSSRAAFERDRHRDAQLEAAGLRVIRVTWRQIVDTPEVVLVLLSQALALAAPVRAA